MSQAVQEKPQEGDTSNTEPGTALPSDPSTEAGQSDSAGQPDQSSSENDEKSAWEGLPPEFAWAEQKVKSQGRENQTLRATINDLKSQLDSAVSPEDFQAAKEKLAESQAKIQSLELDAVRERVVRENGLGDEAIALLEGNSAEAIEAKAKALKALIGDRKPSPTQLPMSGGKTPETAGLPPQEDGETAWREYAGNR